MSISETFIKVKAVEILGLDKSSVRGDWAAHDKPNYS